MAEQDAAPRTRAALAAFDAACLETPIRDRRIAYCGEEVARWAKEEKVLERLDAAERMASAWRAMHEPWVLESSTEYFHARDALEAAVAEWEALGTAGGDRWPHQPGRDPSARATLARLPVLDDPAISEALAAPDDDEETGGGDGQ